MEIDYFEDEVQERSWIWAALANGTSFAMNLVVVAGVTFWMVGYRIWAVSYNRFNRATTEIATNGFCL